MNQGKKAGRERQRDIATAVSEIGSLQNRLDDAYANFNRTTDFDAMDACIYEINALRSRYNTAIKHYRQSYPGDGPPGGM